MLDLARCIKKTQILVWKKHSFLCDVPTKHAFHSTGLFMQCSWSISRKNIYLNIYPLSVPLRAAAVRPSSVFGRKCKRLTVCHWPGRGVRAFCDITKKLDLKVHGIMKCGASKAKRKVTFFMLWRVHWHRGDVFLYYRTLTKWIPHHLRPSLLCCAIISSFVDIKAADNIVIVLLLPFI